MIKLFEENFVYDRYVESGVVTDKENRTVPNIFVKDIEIQFVE
jgi:glutaredoxin